MYLTAEEILKRSQIIVSSYPDDVEDGLGNELVHFPELLKTDVAAGIDSKEYLRGFGTPIL